MRARSSEFPGERNNVTIRYRVRDEAPSSISSLFLVYEGEGGIFSPPSPCQSAATIKSISSPVSRKQTPPFVIRTHNGSSSCTHSHSHKRREGVYYVSTTRPFICCVGQVDKGIKVAMGEEFSPALRVGCKSFCCTTLERCGKLLQSVSFSYSMISLHVVQHS